MTTSDNTYMSRALRLAERGLYTTMPNPRVGCILVQEGKGVREDKVVGEGWHQKAGGAHAEVNAIAAAGEQAKGATAYVTLEPCSHTGKTGPCCEALISAGITRVVYGMEDPNPEVGGRGLMRLRDAGIEVVGALLEDSARDLNPGFVKRMERGVPFVRCKQAMSLDGRTAMASGESKWITGPTARSDVQRLRARSCAVISSAETVMNDSASLTVRRDELNIADDASVSAEDIAARQPLRVILDSQLRLNKDALLFASGGPVLVVHAQADDAVSKSAFPDWVEWLSLPAADGRIDLRALLELLAQRQCNEVLVEAGATLAGSFLRRGLLDEVIIYMAPKLLGSEARPLFELPLQRMASQLPLRIDDIRAIGGDWRITARPDYEA